MFLRILIAFCIILNPLLAYSQVIDSVEKGNYSAGSEYYVGSDLGKPLITVNLVSGVKKPGVYHIPIDTDLLQLVAYAGGSNPSSDLNDVQVKRRQGQKYQLINIDFETEIAKERNSLILKNSDVVHIPDKNSIEGTLKWVSLISGALTIILTGFLIGNNIK